LRLCAGFCCVSLSFAFFLTKQTSQPTKQQPAHAPTNQHIHSWNKCALLVKLLSCVVYGCGFNSAKWCASQVRTRVPGQSTHKTPTNPCTNKSTCSCLELLRSARGTSVLCLFAAVVSTLLSGVLHTFRPLAHRPTHKTPTNPCTNKSTFSLLECLRSASGISVLYLLMAVVCNSS
jgi:hypothetical protein